MAKRRVTADALTAAFARGVHGGTLEDLAREAGMDRGTLGAYERGERPPGSRWPRLAGAAGLPLALLEEHRDLAARALAARGAPGTGPPAEAEAPEGDALAAVASEIGEAVAAVVAPAAARLLNEEEGEALLHRPPTAEERARAAAAWERLEDLPPETRRWVVERAPELHTPAFLDHLCEASVRAAARDPGEALARAELAVALVPLLGAEPLPRLEAHARAIEGNARRVGSELRRAQAAFRRSRELWETGAGTPFPLDPSRRLDLEASLRRDQRRFEEALALLDEALRLADSGDSVARIWQIKAYTQDQQGDLGFASESLERAAAHLTTRSEPRLAWGISYNRTALLVRLARFAEAEPLLPEVRRLAEGLGNDLDLLRVEWMEWAVAGGLGQREEALAGLERVRGEFARRGIAYDAALVSLDLAILRLERGENAEVRRLAEGMLAVFASQGVEREALAAVRLFHDAATRDAATVELARQVAEALRRAGWEPATPRG
jgi:transcriptional regulator with XRE-family HTH domain